MAQLTLEQIKEMLEEAPHLSIDEILNKIESVTHTELPCTMAVVLHHITETKDVDQHTAFHQRLAAQRDKRPKAAIQNKKWSKMVIAMDMRGKTMALVFDDMTTAAMANKMFPNALEIGQPFILCPCRQECVGVKYCHTMYLTQCTC